MTSAFFVSRVLPLSTLPIALALMMFAAPARAEQTLGFPLWGGVYGGWHQTSDDFDVLGERTDGNVLRPGPSTGLRLGWRIVPTFAMELDGGFVFSTVSNGGAATIAPIRLSFAWRPAEEHWPLTPVLEAGAGVMMQVKGRGQDSDLLLSGGLGIEVPLGSLVALRAMASVHGTDGIEASLSWSPVFTFGVDFRAWRTSQRRTAADEPSPKRPVVGPVGPEKPVVPPPTGCPKGVPAARCSDVDGDGLIDVVDRCPVDAGKGASGCPDEDGDGVVDIEDACPRKRGARTDWGCPR